MNIGTEQLKRIMIAALSAAALGLAGCGGEEGKDKDTESSRDDGLGLGGVLLCTAIVLTSGNDDCVSSAGSGSSGSGGSTGSTGGGTTGGSGGSTTTTTTNQIVKFQRGIELEPNDDLINATVPRFPFGADPGQKMGWYVEGTVNDANDTRDAFALTPRRAFRYRIELCPPGHGSCIPNVGIDPLTVFWRLLDHDGNEIMSSQGATSNKALPNLDAGLLYYVVVDAGDTMGTPVGYRLYVHEQ